MKTWKTCDALPNTDSKLSIRSVEVISPQLASFAEVVDGGSNFTKAALWRSDKTALWRSKIS